MSQLSSQKNMKRNELYFNIKKRVKQKHKRVEKHIQKTLTYYKILEIEHSKMMDDTSHRSM